MLARQSANLYHERTEENEKWERRPARNYYVKERKKANSKSTHFDLDRDRKTVVVFGIKAAR